MLDALATRMPRLGPTVEVFHAPAGLVIVPPDSEHRVRIHAGRPVRGMCGRQRFVNERGDVDLVPAGQAEQWHSEAASEWRVVTLPRGLVARAAEEIGRAEGSHLEARCQLRDPRIQHIVWALDAEREAGNANGLLYAEALGLALAFHLLGRYAAPARAEQGLSAVERKRVLDYVEAHLDRSLSLPILASVAGMSTSHFKTLFRRSMGLPVHEYVVQRRVERAKTLLLRAEIPAAEVALASGFAHQSHMARCMRRVLGVNPTQLRRERRQAQAQV
jgi:AraC family transcriptional regulator